MQKFLASIKTYLERIPQPLTGIDFKQTYDILMKRSNLDIELKELIMSD